ncbi:hypothetical protein AOQ84DRAFT_265720, partial [Glonium stellatum]
FIVPQELANFSISKSEFLIQNSQFQNLAVGAMVFQEDRLLLVQRSASERAFPNLWEIPGGSCEDSDETILHGVVRELQEEAGLKVAKFVRQVTQFDWEDSLPHHQPQKRWVKLIFEVEVEVENGKEGTERLDVILDPNEHQRYLWATEEEIRKDKSDDTTLEYMSPENKTAKLLGFRLR